MSWIDRIAFNLNIRGEEPNKILANEIVESNSREGVEDLATYLFDKNKSVSSDVIAVIYHVGYKKPELIKDLLDTFFDLLNSKINRMVWGSMIGISTLVDLEHKLIFDRIETIVDKTANGSLITQIHGINTMASLAKIDSKYKKRVLPILFDYLNKCRPIDFPKRVSIIQPIIESDREKEEFNMIIDQKMNSLSVTQRKKVEKIL